jgi:hypothetical protein
MDRSIFVRLSAKYTGEDAMRLNALTTAAILVAASFTAASASERVYTEIDNMQSGKIRLCRAVKVAGEEGNPLVTWRCPSGPAGWPVIMDSADARVQVTFGRNVGPRGGAIDALGGVFGDPYHTVEWRLQDGQPYAAIQRYLMDGKQAITVHRLNPDKTSCVAAVIAVEKGRDANSEAVRIADTRVPAYRCDKDELIIIGNVVAAQQ